ncbi:uncharacterized protein BDZ99DRAFT_472000 [Mytilinidion resinicola]|uniref:F-box domain-containing protein n=1 Tax=Mytilinidion resinicola TaxID=574789 RepID=A0A6A6Z0I0_9PEZI|nr:uncharacterized protein BDZ99DRAFT_472000 [Mytilinidion resinicola]KAF2814591.1 hypothetical protein BDZ99DRAFT_472000 [Mytilinidion resinicola]
MSPPPSYHRLAVDAPASDATTPSPPPYRRDPIPLDLLPPPKEGQQSSFLQLPVDMLWLIFDKLSLMDQYILSRTCHAMKHVFGATCDSAIIALSPEEYLDMCLKAAAVMPKAMLALKYTRLGNAEQEHLARLMACHSVPVNTVDLESMRFSAGQEGNLWSNAAFSQLARRLPKAGSLFSQNGNSRTQKCRKALRPKYLSQKPDSAHT